MPFSICLRRSDMDCKCDAITLFFTGCSCGAKAAKEAEVTRALRIAATWDAWDKKLLSKDYLEMWEMWDIINGLKQAAWGGLVELQLMLEREK
jgi:hypothetical protein